MSSAAIPILPRARSGRDHNAAGSAASCSIETYPSSSTKGVWNRSSPTDSSRSNSNCLPAAAATAASSASAASCAARALIGPPARLTLML